MVTFGQPNPALEKVIRTLASSDSKRVKFVRHPLNAMDNRGFDQADVLTCLRQGKVYGPEVQNNQLRANEVHRGTRIRVAIGGLDAVNGDWDQLMEVIVVTVMEAT